MSLEVKCFATIIDRASCDYSMPSDADSVIGHIEIHSKAYELSRKNFLELIFYPSNKKEVRYSAPVHVGENLEREIAVASELVFTNYAASIKNNTPLPMLNQPLSSSKNESPEFKSSRFWVFKKYFFVTNRNYSKDEVSQVKTMIHYRVKKYEDELKQIVEELSAFGICYKDSSV